LFTRAVTPNPERLPGTGHVFFRFKEILDLRILSLYMAREFLKLFGFLMTSFVGIYTIFDFIEKVDNFQEAQVATSTMISFFILQIPEIISLLLPMAVLMGTVLTLGLMAKKNEIVAVKSSGISVFRFTLPIILLSLLLALGTALLNETILPQTKAKTNYIWDHLVEKKPDRLYSKEKFWYKGQNSIYNIGFYDSDTQTLVKTIYYHFDNDFNLDRRIDARRVRYLGENRWAFISGLSQERLEGGGYSVRPFTEMILKLPEIPGDFKRLHKPSNEMSLNELAAFVRKIEKEGYDARRYRVDLLGKISFPFVCLIMALWGIGLSLFKEKGASLAPAVILGLGVALLYWVSFSYTRSVFGYSGILPPFLAVWLPNGLFGLGGLLMLSSIKQ
jgi:lipopolysaccharide export system permease protein